MDYKIVIICVVSNFNTIQTLTILVHARLVCYLHNASNSEMHFKTFFRIVSSFNTENSDTFSALSVIWVFP